MDPRKEQFYYRAQWYDLSRCDVTMTSVIGPIAMPVTAKISRLVKMCAKHLWDTRKIDKPYWPLRLSIYEDPNGDLCLGEWDVEVNFDPVFKVKEIDYAREATNSNRV